MCGVLLEGFSTAYTHAVQKYQILSLRSWMDSDNSAQVCHKLSSYILQRVCVYCKWAALQSHHKTAPEWIHPSLPSTSLHAVKFSSARASPPRASTHCIPLQQRALFEWHCWNYNVFWSKGRYNMHGQADCVVRGFCFGIARGDGGAAAVARRAGLSGGGFWRIRRGEEWEEFCLSPSPWRWGDKQGL